jgi:hypothetical protein
MPGSLGWRTISMNLVLGLGLLALAIAVLWMAKPDAAGVSPKFVDYPGMAIAICLAFAAAFGLGVILVGSEIMRLLP